MICDKCTRAGDKNSRGYTREAELLHESCREDCNCQHKIGVGWCKKT